MAKTAAHTINFTFKRDSDLGRAIESVRTDHVRLVLEPEDQAYQVVLVPEDVVESEVQAPRRKRKHEYPFIVDYDAEMVARVRAAGPEIKLADPDDLWKDYDPDALLAAVEQAAGTITFEEADRMKEAIRSWRDQGTRPVDEP